MSHAKKAVNQAIIVFFFGVLTSLLGYFIRLIFAHTLGTAGYGLLYSAIALGSFLVLFTDLGISGALPKFIAEFMARKDKKDVEAIIRTALYLQMGLSIFFGVILFLLSNVLAESYYHDVSANIIIKLLSFLILLYTLERFYKYLFIGFQKPQYFTIFTFIRNFFIILFGLILYTKINNIFIAISIFLASYFVVCLGAYYASKKILKPSFKIYGGFTNRTLFKRIMKYGFAVLLTLIGHLVITYTDTLMLTYFRTLKEVGVYQAALPTAEVLLIIPASFLYTLVPMAAALWATKKMSEVRDLYGLIHKYFFIIMVPLGFILIFYSDLILKILFGVDFMDGTAALAILAFSNLLLAISFINISFFNAIDKPQTASKLFLVAAAINFVLNLMLIPHFGTVGAAIATLVSYLFFFVASSLEISAYKIRLPYLGWVKGLLAGLLFTLVLYLLKKMIIINLWYIEAPIVIVISLVFYLIFVILLRAIKISEIKNIIYVLFIEKIKGRFGFIDSLFEG